MLKRCLGIIFSSWIATVSLADTSPCEVTFEIPRCHLTAEDRETIATCLILEAGTQGRSGLEAVMSVIANRAKDRPELFPSVVLSRGQFSSLNEPARARYLLPRYVAKAKASHMWPTALEVVESAIAGQLVDTTNGATFYDQVGRRPKWIRAVNRTVQIGSHVFYCAIN